MFPCYWVFAPFIWVLKPLLASCWFLYRALVKAVAGIKVSVVTKTRHHSKKRQRPLQPGEEKENFGLGSPPVLPFDIQVLIAKEAHYADLINLSRSSKKLRASFFGSEPVPNVIKSLRQYTCEGATKFECEVCDIQTCEVNNSTQKRLLTTNANPTHNTGLPNHHPPPRCRVSEAPDELPALLLDMLLHHLLPVGQLAGDAPRAPRPQLLAAPHALPRRVGDVGDRRRVSQGVPVVCAQAHGRDHQPPRGPGA